MSEHKIVMTTPDLELGGRDVSFEVKIDGRKRGTLHISQGGLDWQRTRARYNVRSASWSTLIDFMESDDWHGNS